MKCYMVFYISVQRTECPITDNQAEYPLSPYGKWACKRSDFS